jgi:hypothetical protein
VIEHHKGSTEHRFGEHGKIAIPSQSCKEWLALSIQCFERRHKECSGKCDPFEPATTCECVCHRTEGEG